MSSCAECGFALWLPIVELETSSVGLYDDGRFPGRLLVSLHQHFDNIEDVPDVLAATYFQEVRHAMRVARAVTGAERINLAVLGNQEPHVHAHLIPRHPKTDPNSAQSPWNDPRPRVRLGTAERTEIIDRYSAAFELP